MKKYLLASVLMMSSWISSWGQVDEITADNLQATSGSYVSFGGLKMASSAVYAGASARSGNAIALREWKKDDPGTGIVTTGSMQEVKSVQVIWNSGCFADRTLEIYGKNTPFDPSKVFHSSNPTGWGTYLGTIQAGNHRKYDLSGMKRYRYIGIRAKGGTAYLDRMIIEWEKMSRGLAFPARVYEVKKDNAFSSPQLQGTFSEAEVAYSSSNPRVATVDPITGAVKILDYGSTTITALVDETEKYQRDYATYLLMVHPENSQVKIRPDYTTFKACHPAYELGQPLPSVCALQKEDVEIIIKAGNVNSVFEKYPEGNLLKLANGAQVQVYVPEGFILNEVGMDYHQLPTTEAVRAEKESDINRCSYHLLNTQGGTSKLLQIFYSGTYKVKIGTLGLVTFSSARAYVMPEGLKGGVVTIDEARGVAQVNWCVQPGDVVAGHQGLLLKGTPGEYNLLPSAEQGISFAAAENFLRPALTRLNIVAASDSQYYIFANLNGVLGFYWQKGSQEGDQVQGISNKAFLEIPKRPGTAVQGYRLDLGEASGIENVKAPIDENTSIYTPAGVRVNLPLHQLPHGFYIIGGNKMYVK